MINIEYYEVGDCYDAEGRGPFKVIARFTKGADANKYAYRKGNYGSDAKVNLCRLQIAESIDEMTEINKDALRKSALNKLSQAEKEALGL